MIKLITGLWAGVTGLIAAIFALSSRKVGVVTVGLATFASLTVVFVAAINALAIMMLGYISDAQSVLGWLLNSVGIFVPGNFALVVSGVVSAKICRAAYDFGRKKTDIVVYGN